jgi:hypothetical protein
MRRHLPGIGPVPPTDSRQTTPRRLDLACSQRVRPATTREAPEVDKAIAPFRGKDLAQPVMQLHVAPDDGVVEAKIRLESDAQCQLLHLSDYRGKAVPEEHLPGASHARDGPRASFR